MLHMFARSECVESSPAFNCGSIHFICHLAFGVLGSQRAAMGHGTKVAVTTMSPAANSSSRPWARLLGGPAQWRARKISDTLAPSGGRPPIARGVKQSGDCGGGKKNEVNCAADLKTTDFGREGRFKPTLAGRDACKAHR